MEAHDQGGYHTFYEIQVRRFTTCDLRRFSTATLFYRLERLLHTLLLEVLRQAIIEGMYFFRIRGYYIALQSRKLSGLSESKYFRVLLTNFETFP